MFTSKTFPSYSWAFIVFFAARLVAGQDSTPAVPRPDVPHPTSSASTSQRIGFDDFVDSALRQERHLTELMRNLNPMIETYIQEQGSEYRFQRGITPNGDDYFLSSLDLTGASPSIVPFADEETWNQGAEQYVVHDPPPFSQAAFAQALFPDFGHFERQNYSFEFARWEVLGEVRCAVINVKPQRNLRTRGFLGRMWVEDRNYGIVRFRGTFTSKGSARHAFHFDSWRLNTQGTWWMPAYVYTEESRPKDPSHKVWFKAQTRVWGYDRGTAHGLLEYASQTGPAEEFPGEATSSPEDTVVKRLQAAGLMAPEGEVNRILETVVNNILITNNLEITDVRCRVLLTTPLESFVVGRTIVLSRGLLDVLPDEATLAAVLAHELAHIVLSHAASSRYAGGFASPFPDSLIPVALDFHFDRIQEADADKKGGELFSKSPYKDQFASAGLFWRALVANSGRFPILLHGRFSLDFGSTHLGGMQSRNDAHKLPRADRLDQISALPIGSRIVVDPWSDRIEMLKSKPVPLLSKAEKIPFEVTPFYPHLRRFDATRKPQSEMQQ